jgi:hypothetical protein
LTELKSQLREGAYVEPSKKTLAEYALVIMARRLVTGSGLKPTNAATYQRYVAHDIVPSRLGEILLTDIRRSHVKAWIAVPLSDAAADALISWWGPPHREREAAQDAWETQGHVFTMEDGRELDPASMTRLFQGDP